MYLISVYDWSAVTTPANLTADHLENDIHANDPASILYNPLNPSWVHQTYTYTNIGPVQIRISDDDPLLEDATGETGAGAVLLEDVTLNGVTYLAGSQISSEFSLVDSGGNEVWVITIGGTNVGFAPQVPYYSIPYGATFYPVTGHDYSATFSSDGITNSEPYAGVVCMAEGTLITTPAGASPVEALSVGDLVVTLDHGPQPIVWIGRETHHFIRGKVTNQPIRFAPDALGPGRPARPLQLSPQHRVLIEVRAEEANGAHRTLLAPAIGFLGCPGVRRAIGKRQITYYHLLCEGHEIIEADGLCVESLHIGNMTRAALSTLPALVPWSTALARPAISRNRTQRLLRRAKPFGVTAASFLPDAG